MPFGGEVVLVLSIIIVYGRNLLIEPSTSLLPFCVCLVFHFSTIPRVIIYFIFMHILIGDFGVFVA
jgi:hypothetical protein